MENNNLVLSFLLSAHLTLILIVMYVVIMIDLKLKKIINVMTGQDKKSEEKHSCCAPKSE